jgi:hypothetical protein
MGTLLVSALACAIAQGGAGDGRASQGDEPRSPAAISGTTKDDQG